MTATPRSGRIHRHERISALDVPGPTPNQLSRPFWEAARRAELVLPRCEACDRFFFHPRACCPHCWSSDWRWRPALGRGVLTTYTVIHRPGHPGWSAAAPYVVGLVGLHEGPTLLTHVLSPPSRCQVGGAVRVQFVEVGDWVLPCFVLDEPVPGQHIPSSVRPE